MPKPSHKIQLRKCSVCNRMGHNKSTCASSVPEKNEIKSTPAPINFFVHHVPFNQHQSQHVINLREDKKNLWSQAESSTPDKKPKTLFHTYHENPEIPAFALQPQEKISYSDFSLEDIRKPILKKEPEKEEIIIKKREPTNIVKPITNFFSSIFDSFGAQLRRIFSPDKFFGKFTGLSFSRVIAGVVLLGILSVAPIQAQSYIHNLKSTTFAISDTSRSGFSALQESTAQIMQGDLASAQSSLQNALTDFNSAVSTMNQQHKILQNFVSALPVVGSEVQSRQKLLLAGQQLALGNSYLVEGVTKSQAVSSSTLAKRMNVLLGYIQAGLPSYENALNNLDGVKIEALPIEYQSVFSGFRTLFGTFFHDLKSIADLARPLREIVGNKGMRRYILTFQNPDEIRPTGGFMGSIAVVDIKDGQIVKLDVPPGGTYDMQGQLSEYVEPPTPYLLLNKRWEMQDANWFPDFPSSAEKILWFYRHSRGITADGVIALNSSVLERLLTIIGPMTDESRQITITADNALPTLQQVVEYGPEKKKNKPKQILADLAPKFLDYFKSIKPDNLLPLLSNTQEALANKEIQLYLTDPTTEEAIKNFGWGGQIISTRPDQDYLFVVNANIQGQKSDASISQTIEHQAIVQTDGSVLDTVVVSREHKGNAEEKLYGSTNIDYIRIYVPEGSELVSASGFSWPDEKSFKVPEAWSKTDATLQSVEKEIGVDKDSGTRITGEFGKTAFGNWIITEPGQISKAQFVYKLPFKAFVENEKKSFKIASLLQADTPVSTYQLICQRQSGIESKFESQIIYPDGWMPAWDNGSNMDIALNGASISTTLDSDKVWSLVMTKE